MQACKLTESGQGGGKIFVNVDPDGLGPAGFGDRVFVAERTSAGSTSSRRSRTAPSTPKPAWPGTAPAARTTAVSTSSTRREQQNESDDTDVYALLRRRRRDLERGVRVNDDTTTNSQFLPKISLDPTTGKLAVVWYDCAKTSAPAGRVTPTGFANDDAQFWGAFSSNGGASFTPNLQISAGTSNSHDSGNGIDYGDYTGLSFYGGVAHPAWSDNSNSTGTNPDGALHQLDVYTAAVRPPS